MLVSQSQSHTAKKLALWPNESALTINHPLTLMLHHLILFHFLHCAINSPGATSPYTLSAIYSIQLIHHHARLWNRAGNPRTIFWEIVQALHRECQRFGSNPGPWIYEVSAPLAVPLCCSKSHVATLLMLMYLTVTRWQLNEYRNTCQCARKGILLDGPC